jgi:hypothetical protein
MCLNETQLTFLFCQFTSNILQLIAKATNYGHLLRAFRAQTSVQISQPLQLEIVATAGDPAHPDRLSFSFFF